MEPNAPAAPDAGGGAPAQPAAPVAPAAPAAPVDNQQAPNAAEQAEAGEWDGAVDELFPGIRTANKEVNKNEPAQPPKDPAAPEAPAPGTPNPNETPEQKAEREAKEASDAAAADEEGQEPDFTGRDARVAQREYQARVDSVKSDVASKLYANVPKTMVDADGDPIRGIEDVMKLVNPRTITEENPQGRTFTEEEAGSFFLNAQAKFNDNLKNIQNRIDQIAEVNVDLGEQADMIKYKFGELLKVLPDPDNPKMLYRDTLWAEYQKTLEKDPTSGIILRAPMSLETFYNRALSPYARQAQEAEQAANGGQPAAPAPPAPDPNANRQQARTDRSDIFGGTNPNDGQSEDDKEWGAAITETFSPAQLKSLNK